LCRDAGTDRGWLGMVQPWWGHDFHFHVRLVCPSDSGECTPQPPRPVDDGCGQELAYWFTDAVLHPRPSPAAKPKPGPKMADLPAACRQVLLAP
jgi:penicillin-insensitive murein endopeptidase